jgi:hypothetical protein
MANVVDAAFRSFQHDHLTSHRQAERRLAVHVPGLQIPDLQPACRRL